MKSAAIVLVASTLAFSPALAETDATASGEEAYREACAECHRSAERLVRGMRGDENERRERLEAFLVDHHAPEEGMRQSVIAYLLSL